MADRAITALNEATIMTDADLFAISQGGQAKKVTWLTFYSYLAEALDGHGGINDIDYTAPASGSLNGTLTVTLADGTTETFTITNGKGITSVTKTSAVPPSLTDTYTITYNDNTTYQFTVTNGKSIASVADKWAVSSSNSTVPSTWYDDPQTMTPENKYEWHYQIITFNDNTSLDTDKAVVGVYGDTGQDWHVYIKWSAEEPDADSDMKDTPDDWIGIYSGTATTAPTTYTSYTWFEYKGDKGDTGNGIESVSLYSSSGLVDTYRVTFTDGTYTSFNVTNGSSIQSIAKTGTSGITDTYTVTLTNGSTTSFQVVNGKGISSITEVDVTHTAGHTDVYRFNFNDGDTYSFSIYNGQNGSGSVSTVDGIQSDGNQNVALLLLGQGAPTASTVGLLKQRYFDQTNSILYICVGIDTSGAETTYTWQGAGVTVDSALSTMSTNPVQNAVLTAIIGTATLTTTAQTLTQAVNELDAGKVDNGVITEYVETTTTATRAYSIGDHFLLNGVRYEVTAAISSGGTITVGTNVTARNVDADLSSLKTAISNTDDKINPYVSRTIVSNFNSATTNGVYKASPGASNAPSSGYWVIEVSTYSDNDIAQTATDINNNRQYVRTCSSGVWTSWSELSHMNLSGTVSGRRYCKMSDGTMICYGMEENVSDSASIPFPAAFLYAPSVTVTARFNSSSTIRCTFGVVTNASAFSVYAFDTETNARSTYTALSFYWMAVGVWK